MLNLDHGMWVAVQVLTMWSRVPLSMVWCLRRSPFGYAACEAYWILFCYCLKQATGCFGSGPLERHSGAPQCQTLFVTGPWQIVWSYKWSTLVSASTGPGCACEGQSCAWKLALTSTRFGGRSTKFPRLPDEIHCCLPSLASFLLGSVTLRASGYTQQCISFTEWVERESRVWGYSFPPWWCLTEGSAPTKKDGVSWMDE